MKDFDLRKYLAEGRLLKEYLDLEIDEDQVTINAFSGEYSGFIEDDGTVDFSLTGYEEEREDGEIDFDEDNWKDILGPKHAFVKISNQIPTKVEAVDDYVMVTVDVEDLKGIANLAENKLLEIENLSDSESIDAINFITDTLKKVTGYEMEGTTRYGFTIDEPNGFTVTWRDVSDRWTIDLELRQFQAVAYLNIEGRGKIVLDSPEAFEILRTNIISKIGKLESFSSSRWDYDDYDLNNILGITFRNKLLK